ncbi:MAG: phenylacetate--CoA ligase, partial [bacterium]
MPKTKPFWNPEIETMPRQDLEALQADMLRDVVDRAYRKSPFYRDLYRKVGITPRDIRSLEDV